MKSGLILAITLNFLFLTGFIFNISFGKSCNYNNIPALPTWSSVSSPAFPKKFPPQTQCSWKITAPPQYRVELELTSLYLTPANGKNQCIWQWLNIIDGEFREDDGAEPPMLTLCGNNRPRLLISSGNFFKLNLHSNSAASTSHYVGFSARFKYTNQSPYFPDISNLLPSTSRPSRDMDSAPTVKTLGEVLAPFEKKKKMKPKSPNAVQALKNRRTEMENRERNNGVNRNYGLPPDTDEHPYFGNAMEPIESRRATRPPIDIYNLNNMKRELPPKRSKPMPRDIRILLTVLGVVAAIALLLYLAKKFGYDKIHKNKSGKIMDACSPFRRFRKSKKKRSSSGDIETVCKVKTGASQSSESGRGTMKTADSPETGKASTLQLSPFPPSMPCKVERSQNHHVGALENGFNQAAPVNLQVPVTSFDSGRVRDLPEEPVRSRYSSDSSSCDEARSHRRIRRKRRQKDTNAPPRNRLYSDDTARGHSDHSEQYESRQNYRRQNRTRGKQIRSASHNRRQVKCYNSDDSVYPQQPQKRGNWRDAAYS